MDEQARSIEMPRGGGIRKFMNDPKSSVMNYLAENMAAQHLQQQQLQQNPGTSGLQQSNSPYGQQYPHQGSNGLSGQFQNNSNASQTSLTQSQVGHSGSGFQTSSPQPGYSQPSQNPHILPSVPYLGSNISSNVDQPSETHSGEESVHPDIQHQNSQTQGQQQFGQSLVGDISMTNLGKAPPTSSMKHNSSPQSATRLYHRMNLDFEATKGAFFNAKSQHNSQEMTSAAYDLESLSRRIWSLRFEHAWEFDGFQEPGHRAILASWQAQYELWADTVLDIQEGDSAASMFSVHRTASTGAKMSATPSIGATALASGAAATHSYGQPPQQPAYRQGMSSNPPTQALVHGEEGSANESPSMGQNMPLHQTAPSSLPLQYIPPSSMPGGFPPSAARPAAGNPNQQAMPFPQRSMSPPPQQGGLGQNEAPQGYNGPPLATPNGPSTMGPGPQSNQNMPQRAQHNAQQGSFQQMPPQAQQMPPQAQQMPPQAQQMPPQQAGQQMQGTFSPAMQQPPNTVQRPPSGPPTQQSLYIAQRPLSGPPSNSMQPQVQMPQIPPGQIQPPRPDSDLPQSLQAGGR